MKNGEINKDFYCSAGLFVSIEYDNYKCNGSQECTQDCPNRHRKHPTPGQYWEEYHNEGYENDWAVYYLDTHECCPSWSEERYDIARDYQMDAEEEKDSDREVFIVCACTPWGKPPDTWRPE